VATTSNAVADSQALSETTPVLSRDSVGAFVAYAVGDVIGNDIFVRRIDEDGRPVGMPLPIADDPDTDDVLVDAWGSRLVWTEYESRTSLTGVIRMHDLSTGETLQVTPQPGLVREARIQNNTIVWVAGPNGATQVLLYDVRWNNFTPVSISYVQPDVPVTVPVTNVDIGNRYVVWNQRSNDQQDVFCYDLMQGTVVPVANDRLVQERFPATHGDWVVWQQVVEQASGPRASVEARNMRTGQRLTVVDDGALNQYPSIDRDFVSYDSNVNGNADVFLYRISDGSRFQVTTGASDEVLSHVFERFVTYADLASDSDVFVRRF
jgi:hypothetical protein